MHVVYYIIFFSDVMRFVMPQNPSKSPWADKGKMVIQTKDY
jgi:hypothetical protein